ncbi:FUSC family protein [Bradyrhizobium sp.]|uniref:FUSC family protein n=1 Tax=Bradyrhizobium sp. TaxID=376 RepID=UPI003C23BE47
MAEHARDPEPGPIPAAPPAPSFGLRALFRLRSVQSRWPYALRAAFCMGLPVIIGWALNDVGSGLMATLGAFTGLYGSGRPYLSRARLLATLAGCFALAVWLGGTAASAASPWPPILAVALIAATATLLCNALRVGPPGAYMIVLVCAAGTFMRTEDIDPGRTALLALAGGMLALLVHMSGALAQPRAPEKRAVAAAAQCLIDFISAIGSPREALAQHHAAAALHQAWSILVTYQPVRPRPDTTLHRLRVLNRRLNLLFADVNGQASRHEALSSATLENARGLARLAQEPESVAEPDDVVIPLGHFGAWQALKDAVAPRSPQLRIALRAGFATLLAGAAASELGLERAYWAMAAAVLMLHQGLDLVRTLQRGLERMLGTWAGLIIAWGVIALRPAGLGLAATLMTFQFLIEIFVLRNYAIAVAFITPVALTIAAGGHAVSDIPHLLLARGVDTTLGCAIALLVLMVTTPKRTTGGVSLALRRTLAAADRVLACLAGGSVTDGAARAARRDLQHHSLILLQAYDESIGASIHERDVAESFWPAVVAAQRLAYRLLAACWQRERNGPHPTEPVPEPEAVRQARSALAAIAEDLGNRSDVLADVTTANFLGAEISALRASLPTVR